MVVLEPQGMMVHGGELGRNRNSSSVLRDHFILSYQTTASGFRGRYWSFSEIRNERLMHENS